MQPFKWNFEKLRNLDLFFSTCDIHPLAILTNIQSKGFSHAFDFEIPTHSGLITDNRKIFFTTEETLKGLSEGVLNEYNKKHKQIIRVFRWKGFDDSEIREQAMHCILLARQKPIPYDFLTLFTYPQCLRWLRKFFKKTIDNSESEICSEVLFRLCKKFGLTGYPLEWDIIPPSPYLLMQFVLTCDQFVEVKNFKLERKT